MLELNTDIFKVGVLSCAVILPSAGIRRTGGGYEALPGGPKISASLLPEEQPGQDGAHPSVLGANRRLG